MNSAYALGADHASEKYAVYIPLALTGLAAQAAAPLAYGAHAYKEAPEEEKVRRTLDAVGLSLAGNMLGRTLGRIGGPALHSLLRLPGNEAFITTSMLKDLLGGAGALIGGERHRRKYQEKDK